MGTAWSELAWSEPTKVCSEVPATAAVVEEHEHALVLDAVEANHLAGSSVGDANAVMTRNFSSAVERRRRVDGEPRHSYLLVGTSVCRP